MFTVSPSQSVTLKALRTFLLGILPTGTEVFQGQGNRVPEPKVENFVVMTPIRRPRIATNVDAETDVSFVGTIAGTVLTITDLQHGEVEIGSNLFGLDVSDPTVITGVFDEPVGPVSTFVVDPAQTLSSRQLSCGTVDVTQATMVVVQIDVHGTAGADNAQIISTLLRDAYATRAFAELNPEVSPLHADDPRQLPFMNAESQYEDRWVVEATLQVNETASVPQQFADVVAVDLIDVDAVYPPS